MVFPLIPQTQHVISLLMTVNKPLSALQWPVPLVAVTSLAMIGCSAAVNYIRYITAIDISRVRLI